MQALAIHGEIGIGAVQRPPFQPILECPALSAFPKPLANQPQDLGAFQVIHRRGLLFPNRFAHHRFIQIYFIFQVSAAFLVGGMHTNLCGFCLSLRTFLPACPPAFQKPCLYLAKPSRAGNTDVAEYGQAFLKILFQLRIF